MIWLICAVIDWNRCPVIAEGNTASESIDNGDCVFDGLMMGRTMWK